MSNTGQAVAYGAVSILNALATGKGSALSIELSTKATVKLRDGQIISKSPSDTLTSIVVQKVLGHYGFEKKFHGEVTTSSHIPTAVGLKSSSAAANAVALATISA